MVNKQTLLPFDVLEQYSPGTLHMSFCDVCELPELFHKFNPSLAKSEAKRS